MGIRFSFHFPVNALTEVLGCTVSDVEEAANLHDEYHRVDHSDLEASLAANERIQAHPVAKLIDGFYGMGARICMGKEGFSLVRNFLMEVSMSTRGIVDVEGGGIANREVIRACAAVFWALEEVSVDTSIIKWKAVADLASEVCWS